MTTNSWPSLLRNAGQVADLRVVDRERRRLPAPASGPAGRDPDGGPAPARSGRATPSPPDRESRGRSRRGRPPRRSKTRPSAPMTAARSWMFGAVSDGTSAPSRQRLGGVRGDDRLAADRNSIAAADSRLAANSTATGRRRRGAKRRQDAHSTKVTLLISRSVVVPSITRSTADSRRNRIPSSRAAFLISEVGLFSRIISRM